MPLLTVAHPKSRGGTGQGWRVDQGLAFKWMEEVKEDEEIKLVERSRKQQSSNQTPLVHQSQQTSWSQTLRTLLPWRSWFSFLPVGVVWLVCQVEAPLHLYQPLVDVCLRLLLVCLLWMVLGGCVYALKYRLQPGQNQGETPRRVQQEVVTENKNNHCLWMSQKRSPGHCVPLALALADSLLLCVLQEPLPDPTVPHIKGLLSRLESVSQTLERAVTGSEVTLEEDGDSVLEDKVKLIRSYLQQRMRSLCRLVQVQGDFESSVKDMLEGLEGLWVQLEELHTEVTLTKEGSQGHGDLASAQTDVETLFTVLGHYRNRLQCCEAHLKDSTQLLQELTWSYTHMSASVRSRSESVWPELLLQSNIEQFDKVQDSFLPLEQQTSTFQAHLEGLGKANQERHAGPLTHANGAHSRSASPKTSLHLDSRCTSDVERRNSTSTSVSSMDADTDIEKDSPLSLCERSALQFTSTIGRLRKSGRRK
ncbi:uncharacterized protein si:ch211-151h10.2 isoform X2 [Plectropomus leopardus]|uniref:uncharacterized protein si:ch211-151h10.2 isoform X2 n=1 Tax=Plectropomus leopardus TaxID=160734 RepID=UPI001C4A7DDE|nr:uncharacterized protein si:ch211-151h10.2 isoform X2 [Plectropomus leopardus]